MLDGGLLLVRAGRRAPLHVRNEIPSSSISIALARSRKSNPSKRPGMPKTGGFDIGHRFHGLVFWGSKGSDAGIIAPLTSR
eukprot:scaffold5853_cov134-Pinguiococcus_pyrenoidosus.AAC.2